jgi:hypothetical protein
MPRIERLTAEQVARLPEFVERWTKIGLCTEPADRPRAEAAIREMYRQGGLEPPTAIIWCGSPLSLALSRAITLDQKRRMPAADVSTWDSVCRSVGASVRDRVRDSLGRSAGYTVGTGVRHSVYRSVWRSASFDVYWRGGGTVRDSIRTNLAESVEASVWANVGASVSASVVESVRAGIGKSVWRTVRKGVRNSIGESVHGSHDAHWLAFYRYYHDVLHLTSQTARLSGLCELAQSAGWALPHENICWVSERHHLLARDDRGRLHALDGPACAYPDGWAIYAVHGVRVPGYVIERPA